MKSGLIMTVVASWYLVGLSVTVALIVYPSFDVVGDSRWTAFHQHHVTRITWAVGPPWAAQALGLVLWLVRDPRGFSPTWLLCAVAAASSVVITVLGAVRIHDRLHAGFDPRLTRALRRLHWWRTACWLVAAAAATTGLSSMAISAH